ncbi:hypothetical protein HG530_001550 [Fusarium avenaceum]|nr:hypothetical protein HG530_001550 [Fusarium avenaceum]
MFNLTKLNTLSVELDLCVLARDIVQGAVRVVYNQITGLVHPVHTITGKSGVNAPRWMINESLSRLGLVAQISPCNDRSFDDKLANTTNGHETVVVAWINDPRTTSDSVSDSSRLSIHDSTIDENLEAWNATWLENICHRWCEQCPVGVVLGDGTSQVVHALLIGGNANTSTNEEGGQNLHDAGVKALCVWTWTEGEIGDANNEETVSLLTPKNELGIDVIDQEADALRRVTRIDRDKSSASLENCEHGNGCPGRLLEAQRDVCLWRDTERYQVLGKLRSHSIDLPVSESGIPGLDSRCIVGQMLSIALEDVMYALV